MKNLKRYKHIRSWNEFICLGDIRFFIGEIKFQRQKHNYKMIIC